MLGARVRVEGAGEVLGLGHGAGLGVESQVDLDLLPRRASAPEDRMCESCCPTPRTPRMSRARFLQLAGKRVGEYGEL
ncbi:hypothetical protein [Streptomyces sp. BH105]|uniref:hypothetical protein n=1 Tax=Streptomyces sp. BH105 TaxID=3410408 RepID=UPI003CEC2A7B